MHVSHAAAPAGCSRLSGCSSQLIFRSSSRFPELTAQNHLVVPSERPSSVSAPGLRPTRWTRVLLGLDHLPAPAGVPAAPPCLSEGDANVRVSREQHLPPSGRSSTPAHTTTQTPPQRGGLSIRPLLTGASPPSQRCFSEKSLRGDATAAASSTA